MLKYTYQTSTLKIRILKIKSDMENRLSINFIFLWNLTLKHNQLLRIYWFKMVHAYQIVKLYHFLELKWLLFVYIGSMLNIFHSQRKRSNFNHQKPVLEVIHYTLEISSCNSVSETNNNSSL